MKRSLFDFNGTADIGDESDIGAFELQAGAANSISGVVIYGTTPTGDEQKFVPNVTLTAAGTSQGATTTDAAGAYLLSGLGAGAFTVTPGKTGDVNGIDSLDAARIQQHLVGLITLTPNQLIAADVDNNGVVNSLDAARIQQYLVGISTPNIIGQWKFVPANRQYNNVDNNLTGENYVAVLVGDVSGNWTPGSSSPELSAQKDFLPARTNSAKAERFEPQSAERISDEPRQPDDLSSITDSASNLNAEESESVTTETVTISTRAKGIRFDKPASTIRTTAEPVAEADFAGRNDGDKIGNH